jgi:hypothetical protein
MRRGDAVFVALPVEMQRPIPGGCQCSHCKAHPDQTPMWDTLCVDPDAGTSTSFTIHFPEFVR